MSAVWEPAAKAAGVVVSCLSCEVDFDEFTDISEAQHFAGAHNDLHGHGLMTSAGLTGLDDDQAVAVATVAVATDEDGW